MKAIDLEQLAIETAKEGTVPEYFVEMDHDEKLIRGMSTILSRFSDYDGLTVLEICSKALTDCNHHNEAKQIDVILEKLNKKLEQ